MYNETLERFAQNPEEYRIEIEIDQLLFLINQKMLHGMSRIRSIYFRLGMDPPIYQYIEGEGEPKLAWNNFGSFLMEESGNTHRHVKEIECTPW
ncbi:hypothetical protein PghCCS26_41960 [Paenibacillus glycanilyticus]|uniref:Uncharacterized protein n=1 Tax=Paenibacillus glycanilyticus TaxID=126569 RepID=A0ABQ6NPQ9_9BACL|nr:hypothetical protein PghCCS26_41960 [Paenibacillus glycanilyticus]